MVTPTIQNVDFQVNADCKERTIEIRVSLKKIKEHMVKVKALKEIVEYYRVNYSLVFADFSKTKLSIFEIKAKDPNAKIQRVLIINEMVINRMSVYALYHTFEYMAFYSSSVHTVNLSGSVISDRHGIYLAEALTYNSSLSHLVIRNNNFTHVGISAFAEMLKRNTSLKILDIYGHNSSIIGYKNMAKALLLTKSLHTVDMRSKDMNLFKIRPVLKVLRKNKVITELQYL